MKCLLVFFFSCVCFLGITQSYDIVLATDFEGNVTDGSKESLIEYIRQGKPVRVGWQLDFNGDKQPDFDHWVEATFITILDQEVFTQIDPIYAQGPNTDIPQVEIYSNNTQWTAILGTNGKLLNRFIQKDKLDPKLMFDETIEISEEEKQKIIEKMKKNREAMKKVNTWNVATFWSVQQ